MSKWMVFLLLFIIMLSGCTIAGSPTNELLAPTDTLEPPTATAPPATETPSPTATSLPSATPTEVIVPLSFSPTWYRDDKVGFAFQYPAEWQVSDFDEQFPRAIIKQLEVDGEVILQIALMRWDPTNALPEYLAHRREAWDTGSGLEILSEEILTRDDGVPAAAFILHNTFDGDQVYFFYTPIAEYYLELAGNGDVGLLAEVASTLELFEPAVDTASQSDCSLVGPDDEQWVQCNVIDGLQSRNLSALHGFMTDPFTIAYWGSEGRVDTPAGITTELGEYRLPSDTSLLLTFTTDRAEFPPLAGMPPEQMFGPDVDILDVVYSEGWGPDGQGAALLYIAKGSAGNIYWHGLGYSHQHFDK